VAFSPDGAHVAVAGDNRKVHVFDAATGKELWAITEPDNVGTVGWRPDGSSIAAGGSDGTARVLDAMTGKEISRLSSDGSVHDVQFSSDGNRVAAATTCGIRVFYAETGSELFHPGLCPAKTSDIYSIAFRPDGRWVAGSGRDQTARVIDAETGREILGFVAAGAVAALAWSPDGQSVAVGGESQAVHLFNASSTNEILHLTGQGPFRSAALDPNGRWIAVIDSRAHAQVLDLASGNQVLDLAQQPGRGESAVAFSPNGQLIAAGGFDGSVRMLDTAGREISAFRGQPDIVTALVFSADSRSITIKTYRGTFVADAMTGRQIPGGGAESPGPSKAISPNGKHGASASDHIVRVVEVGTNQEMARVTLPGAVSFVSFLPDGQNLIAATPTAAYVIDIAANQEIAAIPLFGPVQAAGYLDGGRFLSLATFDGNSLRVTREPLFAPDLILAACQSVERNLTPAEWRDHIGAGIPYHRTCPNRP
jgi:WD40 repeat protein